MSCSGDSFADVGDYFWIISIYHLDYHLDAMQSDDSSADGGNYQLCKELLRCATIDTPSFPDDFDDFDYDDEVGDDDDDDFEDDVDFKGVTFGGKQWSSCALEKG